MKYIDLTHTLNRSTPVSPFDSKMEFKKVKFLDRDYYNDTEIKTTMHIGTHIDAPSHMLDNNRNICDFPIEKFIGKGVLLNFKDEKIISLKEEHKSLITKDSIVVIYTGMDIKIGTAEYYYEHPQVSEELCDFLIQKKVKMIGLDFFSPDSSPSVIHKKLLANEILIVENLTNLEKLITVKDFLLHMIPIKIDTEGSFIRAYAEIT